MLLGRKQALVGPALVAVKEGAMAKSKGSRSTESGLQPTGVETARVELARVRARFGLDPEIPSQLFAGAWTSPSGAVEEDEAEFVDALADCMSAGLPLGAAVTFWASGELAGGGDAELRVLTERIRINGPSAHPGALKVGHT
jgi:hypothetical protein